MVSRRKTASLRFGVQTQAYSNVRKKRRRGVRPPDSVQKQELKPMEKGKRETSVREEETGGTFSLSLELTAWDGWLAITGAQ